MFKLKMETENDAFSTSTGIEISRLLRKTADAIEQGRVCGKLIDYNGNSVGEWKITEE